MFEVILVKSCYSHISHAYRCHVNMISTSIHFSEEMVLSSYGPKVSLRGIQ